MMQPTLFDEQEAERLQRIDFDVCAKRSRYNPESAAAHESVKASKSEMHRRILAWALTQPYGFTCDEAAIHFLCPPNAISGRLSELKAQGRLVPTGERRKTERGCAAAVLVVKR